MKIAMVIGTYGNLPAMRIQLASRARYYPDVPCLINDDHSSYEEELLQLCRQYKASFRSNKKRLGCSRGDLSAFYYGLLWAYENGVDYLLKLSTRCVPMTDWRPSLIELASTGIPVIGMRQMHTACIVMDVRCWVERGWAEKIKVLMQKPFSYHSPGRENARLEVALYVEGELRALSIEIYRSLPTEKMIDFSKHLFKMVAIKPKEGGKEIPTHGWCAEWKWLEDPVHRKSSTMLWHKTNPPEDYAAYAKRLGVDPGGPVIRSAKCFLANQGDNNGKG